jgi:replicative superfamily II helicase
VAEWKAKVANPRDVTSTLLDTHALAFHLCAEIKNKVIKDYDTMYTWYGKTLASIQSPLEKQHVDEVLTALQNWRAVVVNPDNTFSITALGTVAATLYFHPEDVHHWWQCFTHIERQNLWKSDLCVAYALCAPTMQLPYIPRNEEATVQAYFTALRQVWGRGPSLKQSTLSRDVHDMLTGSKPTPQARPLQTDAERIVGAISWIMGISKMGVPDMLKILPTRLKYGVSAELCALVQLPGIGGVRAKKLASMGITSWSDVIRNPDKVQRVTGEKNLKKVVAAARNLLRVNATEAA